jgi:hypothetical protein
MYDLMSSAGHGRVAGLMRSISSGPPADGFFAQMSRAVETSPGTVTRSPH